MRIFQIAIIAILCVPPCLTQVQADSKPEECDFKMGPSDYLFSLAKALVWFSHESTSGTALYSSPKPESAPDVLLQLSEPGHTRYPVALFGFEQQLFFSPPQDDGEGDFWVTDGTKAGTQLVLAKCNPGFVLPAGAGFVFIDGNDLFRWTPGMKLAEKCASIDRKFYVKEAAWVGAAIVAYCGLAGYSDELGLWRIDQSTGKSALIKELKPGERNLRLSSLTAWNSKAFFCLSVEGTGSDPFESDDVVAWASDGTAGGTHALADDTRVNSVAGFAPIGDLVCFQTYGEPDPDTSVGSTDVWTTDGTVKGTRRVASVAGTTWNSPRPFRMGESLLVTTTPHNYSGEKTTIYSIDLPSGKTLKKVHAPSMRMLRIEAGQALWLTTIEIENKTTVTASWTDARGVATKSSELGKFGSFEFVAIHHEHIFYRNSDNVYFRLKLV